MIQLIKEIIFGFRYKKAIKEAIKAQNLNGRKQFVIVFNGKPVVLSKQTLKLMISTRRFRKGVKIQDIERKALFVTK